MTRVLLVSADVVGERMAGPGIRAWEFARVLSREHEVVLAAPSPAPAPRHRERIRLVEASASSIRRESAAAETLVVQGSALDLFPDLAGLDVPLVVDLYDPYVIENLEIHADQALAARLRIHDQDLAVLRQQGVAGDLFLCASERQRHLWLGVLTALNRVNPLTYEQDKTLRRLVATVPFGISDEPLRRTGSGIRGSIPGVGADDFVILWGGGLWNWFDPLTLIRAVERVAARRPRVRLVFMGTLHPNVSVPRAKMTAQAIQLAKSLGLDGRHVFFQEGWLPYEERQGFLADADLGASLHFENVETTFAFRTRILDYLWAGLPMLLTEGDEFADLARREGFGAVVATGDVAGAAEAIDRFATDADLIQRSSEAARRVRERFRWSVVTEPLLEFCREPYRSPDADRRRSAATPGLGERARRRRGLLAKSWRSLRQDGVRRFAQRTARYIKRRL